MSSYNGNIIFTFCENDVRGVDLVEGGLTFQTAHGIEQALSAVGDLLLAKAAPVDVVVVGGATLNLLGIVSRTTHDVDVIAQACRDDAGMLRLAHAEPFPEALDEAIRTVARDFGLERDWMNAAVGKQWSQGLPPDIKRDLSWRRYGALSVGLVGRRTLIALKLFAAVDQGPRSVHMQDLVALAPSDGELERAAAWVETQDGSPLFPQLVRQAMAHVQQHRS